MNVKYLSNFWLLYSSGQFVPEEISSVIKLFTTVEAAY